MLTTSAFPAAQFSDGSILLSLGSDVTIAGFGAVGDADIVRFTPTSLGATTAGTFTLLLDGSDVGQDTPGEDIDAVGRSAGGHLFVSTASEGARQGIVPIALPYHILLQISAQSALKIR